MAERPETITRVGVVVPARDEERLLPACLRSIRVAADRTPVEVEVVVVANRCSDATARVARDDGVTVVESTAPSVGAARAQGALRVIGPGDGRTAWLACTDADTRVPANWLAHQLALAAQGADLVLGTVRLPQRDRSRYAAWELAYRQRVSGRSHGHVHGANLGVRASHYLSVGGFRHLPEHEDVDLVRRLVAAGARSLSTVDIAVTTSARTEGRTPGGVAADLSRSS